MSMSFELSDFFAVKAHGFVGEISVSRLNGNEWSVHIGVRGIPGSARQVATRFSSIEDARNGGIRAVLSVISKATDIHTPKIAFWMLPAAVERSDGQGNFDGAIEAYDAGGLTGRYYVKLLGGFPQGRDAALCTARSKMEGAVDVTEDGEICFC